MGEDGVIVEGSKTEEEGHTVFLDPISTAELRTFVDGRFPAEFLAAGNSALGCHSRHGFKRLFSKISAEVGRHLSTKTFRQTYITLSRLANVADALTREQVGHTLATTSDIYTRPPVEPRKQAARQMGTVILLDGKKA